MTKKPRTWKTIEEHLADPAVQARREASMRATLEAEQKSRQETAGLRAELAAIGVQIDLVWDLVNARQSFPAAMPILLEHLGKPYDDRTREGVARALADKAAKPYAQQLLGAFRAEDDAKHHFVKWAIGNALTVAAGRDYLPQIIQLALDPAHGKARTILLLILHRSKKPEAKSALMRLLSDPDPDVRMWAESYVAKSAKSEGKRKIN